MAMTDFDEAYNALNKGQRLAVDTIDGPVLVVAGPGTGKTQLLSMRAANILRRTDAAPNNILCLTFTESAAIEMRQRLIKLMGPEGNRVAVHTFHNFGADIINHYPEHFYNGARFAPADELTGYELLRGIFEELPHNNPLAKTMNGEFTALKDTRSAISHLKRAGLLPKELLAVLDHNHDFYQFAEPLVAKVFADRLSKKAFPAIRELVERLARFIPNDLEVSWVKPVAGLVVHELQLALNEAEESGKTTALTAWRNAWCERAPNSELAFKGRLRADKLRALAGIYKKYGETLLAQELYDFDDMVSLVAHTLETADDLRLNLQEQYQYVMVDEFQDTNGAQLRLLAALTDSPVNEGRPNVLAVGDDDQAIYAFQGAELNNIVDFATRYRDPQLVVLTDNYRSTAPILEYSRKVVLQAGQRLENMLSNVTKELTPHNTHTPTGTEHHQFATAEAEYHWIANDIKKRMADGTPANDIAVIARGHKHLASIMPYLHAQHIAANYERRNNVLESRHVRELITLAEVMVNLGQQRFDVVEELLPELLSYDFWGLKTEELWQLSINAYKQRRMWLELMVEMPGQMHGIAEFLVINAHRSLHNPCQNMLDMLIGSSEHQVPNDDQADNGQLFGNAPDEEEFTSPYRAYYFNQQRLQENPAEYLTLLSNLRVLLHAVNAYRPDDTPNLATFVEFVELCRTTNTPVVDTTVTQEAHQAVHVMTAHRAKGMEFGTVYVVSCHDDIWGRKTRRPSSSLSFPANLPIEPAGQHYDDAVRLFFVAMTRAKHTLILSSHLADTTGKERILAEFLQDQGLVAITHKTVDDLAAAEERTPGWQDRHIHLPHITQAILLAPLLQAYRLSATHLNNFTDVTRGGPQAFLLQNLLRFPQAMTPSQAYGHAVHAVLARAHTHLAATGEQRPIEDILHDFEIHLQNSRLNERDLAFWLEKGSSVLTNYIKHAEKSFTTTQKAERNFAGQEVVVDGVRLTGMIDLMDIDEKNKKITITDYKTGKSFASWRGISDFDKIKLHKYQQQLMFYKLLVEHSRDYHSYKVEKGFITFVEPDSHGQFHTLEYAFDDDELATFKKLLQGVWKHIGELDFPDVSGYSTDFKGVVAFEQSLIA